MASTQTGWFDHTALDNAIERSRKVKKKKKTEEKVPEGDVQHAKMIAQHSGHD